MMRWTLTSVRHASRLLEHMSAYRTAKILRVSLGVIQRLARKLPLLGQKILLLGKARGFGDTADPISAQSGIFELPRLWLNWMTFVFELSLILYPLLHKAPAPPQ